MNSKDIAKLAGVARSTVSKVINDYPNIPQKTKDKVWKVIRENDYVPNSSAQMLAGKKSKIIGVFIVDIESYEDKNRVSISPYFSSMVTSFIDHMKAKGYNTLVSEIVKEEDFKQCEHLFSSKTISGGIFLGVKEDPKGLDRLLDKGYNMVFFDKKDFSGPKASNLHFVNPNNLKGASKATQYLIDNGHRKIMHVTGDLRKLSSQERRNAFKNTMEKNNIEVKDGYIINGDFTEEGGYRVLKEALNEVAPTAVFFANDSMAIGGMKAISEMGLKIPEDISIIGFDDLTVAKYVTPPLTTIKISVNKLAKVALDSLIDIINEDRKKQIYHNVEVELIERGSVKKI